MANGGRPGTLTIDLNRAVRPLASGVTATLNADPGSLLVRGVQRGLDVANSVSRQVLIAGGPLGSWADSRSMTSRFEVLSVPGARLASLALGGSRNTLLVAAAASGLGLYLERHDGTEPRAAPGHAGQPASQQRSRRQLVRARYASRCRLRRVTRAPSSELWPNGWPGLAASRPSASHRRWPRRSAGYLSDC